jgi:hypothetical protein
LKDPFLTPTSNVSAVDYDYGYDQDQDQDQTIIKPSGDVVQPKHFDQE